MKRGCTDTQRHARQHGPSRCSDVDTSRSAVPPAAGVLRSKDALRSPPATALGAGEQLRYVKATRAPDEIILAVGRFPRAYDWVSFFWLFTIIGIPVFIMRTARKRCTELAVTSKRFVYKRGIISRVTDEVATNRIRHVKVTQGFMGRIFDYGQIYIEGAEIGGVGLPPIRKPTHFRRALIVSGGAIPDAPPPPELEPSTDRAARSVGPAEPFEPEEAFEDLEAQTPRIIRTTRRAREQQGRALRPRRARRRSHAS